MNRSASSGQALPPSRPPVLRRRRKKRARPAHSPEESPVLRGPIFGAVTRKEISAFSRRWQTYLGRVIYVALIGLVLLQFRSQLGVQGLFSSMSEYANLSREIFRAFVTVQLVFVTLVAMASGADLLTRELRAGTLELLVLSPLPLSRIVGEKWKASMAQCFSLILCGLPVLAICVYLGGVGLWELAWSTCLTLACSAMGSALALRYSATQPTATRAVLAAALMFAVSGFMPFVLCLGLGPYALKVTPFLHPLHAAVAAATAGPDDPARSGWIAATPLAFLAAILTVGKAARETDRRMKSTAKPHLLRGDRLSLELFTSRLPWLRPLKLTGGVWEDRPLLWKELATRPGARVSSDLKQMTWIYYLLFLLIAFALTMGRSLMAFAGMGTGFALLAAIGGASLFAPDKEGHRLYILCATPVTNGRLVGAKLAAAFLSPEGFMGIALWALWVIGWSWWTGWSGSSWSWIAWVRGTLIYAVTSGLFLLFAFALGAWASLRTRTLRGAFLLSLGSQVGILLALPLGASVLRDLVSRPRTVDLFLRGVHPLALLQSFVGGRERLLELIPYAILYSVATVIFVSLLVRDVRRVSDAGRV